jgi:hypothetical protein
VNEYIDPLQNEVASTDIMVKGRGSLAYCIAAEVDVTLCSSAPDSNSKDVLIFAQHNQLYDFILYKHWQISAREPTAIFVRFLNVSVALNRVQYTLICQCVACLSAEIV